MAICTITADEFAEFIAFINAGMRPDGAPTRAEEDFPVILGRENLAGLWGLRDREGFAAGLSCLVRPFTTDHGTVLVAGIGSVVTRADRRGEGLSGRIQQVVLDHLREAGVHLAVLWTDRPEIYARRGFAAAGYEYHVDVAAADLPSGAPAGAFHAADAGAVAAIYRRHPLRTMREASDDAALYAMPGTRGLVSRRDGAVQAYVFCGKGEDFPGYVAEWGGPVEAVLPLLAAARAEGLASRVLAPAGAEPLVAALLDRGAGAAAVPCGLWSVLSAEGLGRATGRTPQGDPGLAASWLGAVGEDGTVTPGPLRVAVWGFDSV